MTARGSRRTLRRGAVTLDCRALDRVRAAVGSFYVNDVVKPVEPFGEPARQAVLR
jgi:hypothetical protein